MTLDSGPSPEPDPFSISSDYVDALIALHPLFGTMTGRGEHDTRWPDYGPDGWDASHAMHVEMRRRFAPHVDHADPIQRLAARVMERLMGDRIERIDAGDQLADMRHMASAFQGMGRCFDMMSRDDATAWDAIVIRLRTMDTVLGSYRQGLGVGIERGRIAAIRQVESVIKQAMRLASDTSQLNRLRTGVPDTHAAELDRAIAHARSAYGDFAEYLVAAYAPAAPTRDAVGAERYSGALRQLMGADIDPLEAYAWGFVELNRLLDELRVVGARIMPDADLDAVVEFLRTDPEQMAHSREEFVEFVEGLEEQAFRDLAGTHFDVAEPLRSLTINMAPDGSPLGAYYLAPSEDFSRPGGVWYSMGEAQRFPKFHAVSTAYHEGFPGHHLQRGTAMVNTERVSRGQRMSVWYPGYSEGWAMYAERLMGELGYLETPAYEFGMLTKQAYRAARVVVDIGLHLELELPENAPMAAGERWTYDLGVAYMKRYGTRTDAQAANEVMRYLGWPGQAPTYKLGERAVLELRAQMMARDGDSFDLGAFHDRLIGFGPMPFDLLGDHVLSG